MLLTLPVAAVALASGALVGLMLGLVGGGGSILAVPLLVYVVGVSSTQAAIGTAAVAVTLNAATSLAAHALRDTVKWPCAIVFALSGIAGTVAGAELGKAMDGQRLLGLFGLMMVVIGIAMALRKTEARNPDVRLTRESAKELLPRLVPGGLGVGFLSGFFGIGGGFLIVPALLAATGMALPNAIATSLVAVTAFGATTAASYAWSGYVDWWLAACVILGGIAGGLAGAPIGSRLGQTKRGLSLAFAAVVVLVGLYVAARATGLF